jgi:pimeloyl-ACP methyl ester carboxylesterase
MEGCSTAGEESRRELSISYGGPFDSRRFDYRAFDRRTFDRRVFDCRTFDRRTFGRRRSRCRIAITIAEAVASS